MRLVDSRRARAPGRIAVLVSGLIAAGCFVSPASAVEYGWCRTFGASAMDIGLSISLASAGGAVVAGRFTGTVDFGSGPLESEGASDGFVVKIDADGQPLWSRRFGGPGNDQAASVATLPDGGSLVTGFFSETVDFGRGPLTSAGMADIFVVRLDADGNTIWSRRYGGLGTDLGNAVAVTPEGGAVVTGYFTGVVPFGLEPHISSGFEDVFVLKLDGDGQVVWSRSFGSFDSDFGNGVAATFDGGAFVTGMFRGTVVFDGLVLVSAGGPDAFVLSLNPDGTRRWAGRFGGPFGDYGMSIAAAPDAGCYVTGIFQGSVNFGTGILTSAGYDDAFVMKLDPTGITRWSRRYGGTLTDRGMSVSATPEDEAVVTGYFAQTIDFGGGPFTTAGANDIFVVKLNRNGTHVWSQRFGSASDDYGNGAAGIGRGGALVTGSFSDSANFGGGVEHSAGAWDAFAVRLGPQGIPAAGTGLRLVLGSALAAVAALVLRRRSA